MKLPSYPIVTIDPHFSIWSRSEKLTDTDTTLWCGFKKRLEGKVTVDGETFRFLGEGKEPALNQVSVEIKPLVSSYTFENEKIRLVFSTWTPFILNDYHLLSAPCAYLDTVVSTLDGKKHDVSVQFTAHKEMCQGKRNKPVTKYTDNYEGTKLVKMGLYEQHPLNDSGDEYSADWGYVCLLGQECGVCKEGIRTVATQKESKKVLFTTVIAYDDIYSINYFGQYLRGVWTEKFADIGAAMKYMMQNREAVFAKVTALEKKILNDAKPFGKNYQMILSAALRQVLAGHKLVRNGKGELLYLSKECHSNGCINTVDVSYPAMPLFLLYAPELVKAMMTGIFYFADSDLWNLDFAPHDIGRYPLACGQVYGLKPQMVPHKISYKTIYKQKSTDIYKNEYQMPVEECGNMLIMSYAYYIMTKDTQFLTEHFYTLSTWAKYLKSKGVILDNQLCTDDFAGHSKKNVNLAIKGIMGIACFGKICDALQMGNNFGIVAKSYTQELILACKDSTKGYLPFSVDGKNTWSLKYNLVWDKLFGFNLFPKEIAKAETEKYVAELNCYGVPLDYRKPFTKTDWMLWAACLDETETNVDIFSGRLVNYLAGTKDRNSFSDWIDTKRAKQHGFDHRTVQGGLWMPILKKKLESMDL